MKPIRAVFAFEALLTLVSGLQGLVAPAALATQFVAEAPPAPALDFVRWLGPARPAAHAVAPRGPGASLSPPSSSVTRSM